MSIMRCTAGVNLLLLTIVGGLLVGVAGVPGTKANHESGFYLASIRSIAQTEQYCVEDSNTTLGFSTALDRVRDTLIVDRTDVNWDLKQGGYTDFRTTWSYSCYDLNSSTTPTRNEIEIEYYVEDTTTEPGCGGTSCAKRDGPYWSGPHGRTEYTWYYVWLRGNLIKNGGFDTHHVVNHETGHVFGLADGGPTSGSWDTSCPSSIMHTSYYGCSVTLEWPSLSTDHPSVNDIIYGNP